MIQNYLAIKLISNEILYENLQNKTKDRWSSTKHQTVQMAETC